ncbi:MAG: GDP-mannose 4,6-dehydratase [Actinobacteria bacterium]|nr:GDP-mannose 4,6-dehydratase [Actinomycetota bacterium]
MTRKALVTGGAGFVGSHLVDLLVDRNWEVLVVDDLSSGKLDNLAAARRRGKVSVHVTGIGAPELAEVAGKYGPEVVFHLAAQVKVPVSVADPLRDAETNVLGTLNVLESARRSGARKIVFASSGGAVYGPRTRLPATERAGRTPPTPYGISKKIVEDYFRWYAENHSLDYVLLAPSNIYGPRQDAGAEGGVVAIFIEQMLADARPTVYGDGNQTRDFVYVADVVDAFARAADAGSGVFLNVASGVETSVVELYDLVARLVGYPVRPDFTAPRAGDVPRSVLDPSRAKAVLGWEPWTPLDEGLEATVAWFRRPA